MKPVDSSPILKALRRWLGVPARLEVKVIKVEDESLRDFDVKDWEELTKIYQKVPQLKIYLKGQLEALQMGIIQSRDETQRTRMIGGLEAFRKVFHLDEVAAEQFNEIYRKAVRGAK